MKTRRTLAVALAAGLAILLSGCAKDPASQALDSIRGEDMRFPMKFLGSAEFQGRSTPSSELDIASWYIALTAERLGLKPLMPGGSYLQAVPLEVTTVAPCASGLRLRAPGRERSFSFPAD